MPTKGTYMYIDLYLDIPNTQKNSPSGAFPARLWGQISNKVSISRRKHELHATLGLYIMQHL